MNETRNPLQDAKNEETQMQYIETITLPLNQFLPFSEVDRLIERRKSFNSYTFQLETFLRRRRLSRIFLESSFFSLFSEIDGQLSLVGASIPEIKMIQRKEYDSDQRKATTEGTAASVMRADARRCHPAEQLCSRGTSP